MHKRWMMPNYYYLRPPPRNFVTPHLLYTATTGIAPFEQVVPGALEDLVNGEISQAFPHIWSYLLAGSFPVFGYALR